MLQNGSIIHVWIGEEVGNWSVKIYGWVYSGVILFSERERETEREGEREREGEISLSRNFSRL